MRLFKAGTPVDLAAKHSAVIFTRSDRLPVSDVEAIDVCQLSVFDASSHPCLFRDHQTFKRPPHSELEMFRAIFELFPTFIMEYKGAGREPRLEASTWVIKRLPFFIPGDAHPVQATVSHRGVYNYTADRYRGGGGI